MTKLTTLEKVLKVKKLMDSKEFTNIEKAAKRVGISPATYHDYKKSGLIKVQGVKTTTARTTTAPKADWPTKLERLQEENRTLKTMYEDAIKKLELASSVIGKLKDKIVELA